MFGSRCASSRLVSSGDTNFKLFLFDLQKKQRAEKRPFSSSSSSEEKKKKKSGSFKVRRVQLSDAAEEEEPLQVNTARTCRTDRRSV